MAAVYPAHYKDRFGEEQTSIHNDGKNLSMIVRGVEFEGSDFDSFEPKGRPDPAQLSSFTLSHGSLCFCVIETGIPIPVATPLGLVDGILSVELELGSELPSGGIDREVLKLQLSVEGRSYTSKGNTGLFETEMLDLQRQLPPSTLMRTCINCAFSDYFPAGNGLFGCLACFRGNKAGYRGVSCKRDLFDIWATMTEFVQETHSCPEFEQRVPGTGYRG
jgi:hypothetical protein